jgi:hypothetical protein
MSAPFILLYLSAWAVISASYLNTLKFGSYLQDGHFLFLNPFFWAGLVCTVFRRLGYAWSLRLWFALKMAICVWVTLLGNGLLLSDCRPGTVRLVTVLVDPKMNPYPKRRSRIKLEPIWDDHDLIQAWSQKMTQGLQGFGLDLAMGNTPKFFKT